MRFALKMIVTASLACVLSLGVCKLWAAEQNDPASGEPAKTENMRHHNAYLGLKVEAVRPGTLTNVPEQFHQGQGVRVMGVMPGSPAEKAGVKQGDIIMSFDDQRLFSPLQFVGLVRNDKPGREAELTLLRDNKPEQVKVTIGHHDWRSGWQESENKSGTAQENPANGANQRQGTQPSPNKASGKEANQETFDSLLLENVGKDRFKVQIEYLDRNNKLEKHRFDGTIKELHQKIAAEKDLPARDRAQLLRSLDLPSVGIEIPGISFRVIPPTDQGEQQSDGTF